MVLKHLVTPEQRETKAYKVMRVYYFASWTFLLMGVLSLMFLIVLIFYHKAWPIPKELIDDILWFLAIPLIFLSCGIYGTNRIKKGLREANWDYIFKVVAENEHPPWTKRQR